MTKNTTDDSDTNKCI